MSRGYLVCCDGCNEQRGELVVVQSQINRNRLKHAQGLVKQVGLSAKENESGNAFSR